MKKNNPYEVANRYLSYKDRTVKELKDRLIKSGTSRQESEHIINEYIDNGYLNDVRYCTEKISSGFRRGKGIYWIKSDCLRRGVQAEEFEKSCQIFEDENQDLKTAELESATRKTEKFIRELRNTEGNIDEKGAARLARRLESSGYSQSVIIDMMKKIRSG